MLIGTDLWARHGRGPWILAGHHLTLAPGEVRGLFGPSGCGKSTLAAVLAGLHVPARGTVEVDGAALASIAGPRPVQLVLQHPERAMNPRWKIGRVLDEARPDGAERSLAEGDLVQSAWFDRYPHELSGGELQRVNLARALVTEPSYLLADEISASLDAITQALLWSHLRDHVARRRMGVLAVSHDRALLAAVADEVVEFPLARPALRG
ncbi:ABC transporter ATP-binding protein [Nocardioides daphniae]|uniref:ATP-binding cassette domain-containing protein n=1 Tax=Nocardioides daphniae TaxID=402297 RepID=A0A4P7U8S8_9ACTN|nr:ATP-binding cassette domain-containing protein [Nocardioides daphniae]QCC76490.1 ATP-binding cassette domain-containing protein [Nocardioides daphniae]GGD06251.1 peptide ABC transporter [Nocardioides daphniae]